MSAVTSDPKILHNFNAGPAVLPREVFEEASRAVLNFNDTGLSLLEIGHRTKLFQPVLDEAIALMKELMELDSEHEVLFMHGGASTQFFQVPMNLLDEGGTASYTDTGTFAAKALKEARGFGNVEVVCSSKESRYNHLPKGWTADPASAYLHLTSNNTIEGTQWQDLQPFYDSGIPLVADMSSDILSRRLDFNRFDFIYAGAQKNIGAAGVNIVVVNPRCLGKVNRKLPSMMDYRQHIDNGSMLNTPPVFAIYICMLTLRWLKAYGGVGVMEADNRRKAALFYDTLDRLPLFRGTVAPEDRSIMNGCFVIDDPAVEKEFLQWCEREHMVGIKGHRSVGGFRISMYNALPYESVVAITDLMREFAAKRG
ncbi:MAG TPA: 3-phosphoserine/phosphohydroxythreonine transaminase [Chitinophagaceae bacterium]|nr:3-phosphoserine/phosphohydroxythreonine transaminase [Chitinophagaceae bacterium]